MRLPEVLEPHGTSAAPKVGLAPRAPRFQCLQLPERYGPTRVVSRRFLRVARRAGLPVQVWVVNAPADMTRLFEWGVQLVIIDVPDVALATVRSLDPDC